MTGRRPIVLSWSGGKDSTLALAKLLGSADWHVHALLTTVTADFDRISMHGVRRRLLEAQAHSLGVPLRVVEIPSGASNAHYGEVMAAELESLRHRDVQTVAFGDLFLSDVRRYREEMLASVGMNAHFPLWGLPTPELARTFVRDGYRSIIVCVDTQQLDADFAGHEYDDALLDALPPGVDPCGENGETHSFVYDGPIFSEPVRCQRGERVLRDERFMYQDLV